MLDDATISRGLPPTAPAATGAKMPVTEQAATAPRIYNLFPLLVGTVEAWAAELPRIAAMNFDWVYLNPIHESGFSGSLYAIKSIDHLDPRFRTAPILRETMPR